jgi:hypothetical protein
VSAVPAKDHDRRGARPTHLWHRWPDRRTRIATPIRIDRRTSLGRLLSQFKADVERRVVERKGEPDGADQALIQTALLLRADLFRMESNLFENGHTGTPTHHFVAAANALHRTLAALGIGEAPEIDRQRAESSQRTVEARLIREFTR